MSSPRESDKFNLRKTGSGHRRGNKKHGKTFIKWTGRSGEEANRGSIPCFHFTECKGYSVVERNGKSLCRKCSGKYSGPVREIIAEPESKFERSKLYYLELRSAYQAQGQEVRVSDGRME